jgi:hypothetical protein
MSDLSLILISGDHKRNAEKLRAWLAGDGAHHMPHAAQLVEDWKRRGYLDADGAREVLRG